MMPYIPRLRQQRTLFIMIALAGLAFGVRLIALGQNYVIATDSALYINMAKLFAGEHYHQVVFSARAYYAFFPLLRCCR